MLKLSNAAVQRGNLNAEKANNMEVGSTRRMYGNSIEISIVKPQCTDFCFMEVHSSLILSSYRSVGLPCGISMVGFTQISSCPQSLSDENFQKLIKNGKLRISLFFRQVCWVERHCDCCCSFFVLRGAMVLGKLSVPGRPTHLE